MCITLPAAMALVNIICALTLHSITRALLQSSGSGRSRDSLPAGTVPPQIPHSRGCSSIVAEPWPSL